MSVGSATALTALTLFPSPDHMELGVGSYAFGVDGEELTSGVLEAPQIGLEVLGRRIFDTTDPEITGTGENFRLRMYRDSSGYVRLDNLSYDSLLVSLRSRPELGDELDLGFLLGSWEEVWAWDTGSSQFRVFVPVTMTLLGFSKTDQDDDSRMKHYTSAGAGLGGEALTRVAGPFGLQARLEGKARTTNRHRADLANLTRHEVRVAAETGISWVLDRKAWVLGGWGEFVTQWEPRDAEERDGVDRQYLAAGIRLSGRFYKEAPIEEDDARSSELDLLLEAIRSVEREGRDAEEPVAEELAERPVEQILEPSEGTDASDLGEEYLRVHWSEVAFVERVAPIYPSEVEPGADAECVVEIFVDAAGVPVDVRPESCDAPWLQPSMQAVWQWEFEPVVEDGTAVPVRFSQPMRLDGLSD